MFVRYFFTFLYFIEKGQTILRKEYLKILGLNISASKEDIKKAFRSKAKTLHPDKNSSTKAQEEFIELCEAYEALMSGKEDNSIEVPRHQSTRSAAYYSKKYNRFYSEEEFQEKMRRARQHAELKRVIEKNIHNIGYQQLITSLTYRVAIIMGIITIIIAGILSLDYLILPKNEQTYYVTSFADYGTEFTVYLSSTDVRTKPRTLELDYSIHDFGKFIKFRLNDIVQVDFTPMFHQPVSFYRKGIGVYSSQVKNESTFYIAFWPIVVIFYLPVLIFIFRGKNSFFIIFTPVTIYLSSLGIFLLIYYLIVYL